MSLALCGLCVWVSADSALYRLLSSDHTPSKDEDGVWLSEVREVFCEEVRRRGTLPNDCKIYGVCVCVCVCVCVFTLSPPHSVVVVLLERVTRTWPHPAGKMTEREERRPSPSSIRDRGSEMIIRYIVH